MITSKVTYLGNLRNSCEHIASGATIITDAPVDNHGQGSAFSPTDLMATSYASCMITIIGIYCNSHGFSFENATAEVVKIMGSEPRRIAKLEIRLNLSGNAWNEDQQKRILAAAKACPVAKTLGDNVEVDLRYNF